ncbi:hypothetical protein DFH09DRAFT_1408199 [Mycena vulgaris]|nr:hypothetical protein DFH09DRAFT_1408199 [Mycena vulgaris]
MFTALLSHPSVFLPDLRSMKMGEMEMDSALLTLIIPKNRTAWFAPPPRPGTPVPPPALNRRAASTCPMSFPQRVCTRSHPRSPATISMCCTVPSPRYESRLHQRVRWRERTPTCAPQRAQQLRATRPRLRLARPQRRIWRGEGEFGVAGAAARKGAVPGHSARHARHTACTPGNVMSSSFSTMLSLRPPPPPIVPAAAPPPPPPDILGCAPGLEAHEARELAVLEAHIRTSAHGARRRRHVYVKSWRKWRKGDARTGSGAAAEECCEAHRPRGRRGVAAQGRLPVALAIVLALPVLLAPPTTTVRPVTYFSPPERPATAAALFDSLPSGASGLAASYATIRVRRAR